MDDDMNDGSNEIDVDVIVEEGEIIGDEIALDEEILEHDARISEIFYYFASETSLSSGRTVGRKIGVVQELLLRRYLEQDISLRRRMYLEQFLQGASGASHKVEFSWYAMETLERPSGGDEIPGTDGLKIMEIDETEGRIRVGAGSDGRGTWITSDKPISKTSRLARYLAPLAIDLRVHLSQSGINLDVIDRSTLLASLESKRVGAQRFSGSDKLGSGIQTIEKAKQASLVAIDIDLKNNGTIKPLQGNGRKRTISVVALGNGVHWTTKDLQVLDTYVDFTYLVTDAAIIRYAEFVRKLTPAKDEFLDFFMNYFQGMTVQGPDGFISADDDFKIIVPNSELRSLNQVLSDHIGSLNPI
jgi:hypothetical protein